jgi:hypothetical protein
MTLRLNGSTSGYAEIDAPAVAGSNTLLLPASNGNAYQFLRNGATAGTTEFAAAITSGTAVASTSGTSIDFTSIPSYVKRITVMLSGVSTSGGSNWLIQIGDSGGIETTGYLGAASTFGQATINQTIGFALLSSVGAASVLNGIAILTFQDATAQRWCFSSSLGYSDAGNFAVGAGAKVLSPGTLDRIRITTVNGTDTFDAGSINILME